MSTILQFLKPGVVFDAAATRALGEAFDAVCASLQDRGQPKIVREIIAGKIIVEAAAGERDPAILSAMVLAAIDVDRRHS
jgi:hypothetical protein